MAYFGVWAAMLGVGLVLAGGVWLGVRQLGRVWPGAGRWLGVAALVLVAGDVLNLWGFKPFTYLTLSAAKVFSASVAGLVPFTQVMSGWLPAESAKPLTLFVALVGGGFMAAVAGLVVGMPTLRLRGDYLAIATLGFAEIIRVVILNSEPLGRATGLSLPVYFSTPDPEYGITAAYMFPWVYGAVLITWLAVWRLQHSPRGRALECLREDEIAAAAVGINVTTHKVLAFVFGAFFAGVAGVLYGHYEGYINPQNFTMTRSIEIVVFVTLGGLGSLRGAVIATVLLTVVQSGLQTAKGWMPAWAPAEALLVADWMNQYRPVIYAALLVGFMLARSRSWGRFGRKVGA
jgi:ABC-type branched-subunit amino acid transport system permease subunit